MSSLNRCPRCSRRRAEGLRFCPGCAYDYEAPISETPPTSGWSSRDDDAALRRDIARYALGRQGVNCRARLGGCIGLVIGFVVGGLLVTAMTPHGTTANPFVALIFLLGGALVGSYIGPWLVVRGIAR